MPSVRIDHQGCLIPLAKSREHGVKTLCPLPHAPCATLGFGLHIHPHSFYPVDPLNLLDTPDHFVKVV